MTSFQIQFSAIGTRWINHEPAYEYLEDAKLAISDVKKSLKDLSVDPDKALFRIVEVIHSESTVWSSNGGLQNDQV